MQKSIRILLVLAGLAFVQLGQLNTGEQGTAAFFAETPGLPPSPYPPPPPPGRV